MAKRRMLHIELLNSDSFTSLPPKSQLLYFQMNFAADDDGFVGNVRGVMRLGGFTRTYLNPLLERGYVIEFKSGVAVIAHWNIHNQLRKDRHIPTRHVREYNSVYLTNGIYVLRDEQNGASSSDFFGNQMATQYSIGEVSEVKENSVNFSLDKSRVVARSPSDEAAETPSDTENDALSSADGIINNLSYNPTDEVSEEATDTPTEEISHDDAINEKSNSDSPSCEIQTKSFYETLTEEERRKYKKFLNELKLYYMSTYHKTDCEGFIKYNESRFWVGRRGESVITNYKKYLKEWIEHDIAYILNTF